MVLCTRCAYTIDEEPLPERCPQCGRSLTEDTEPDARSRAPALARLRLGKLGEALAPGPTPPSSAGSGANLPMPLDADADGTDGTGPRGSAEPGAPSGPTRAGGTSEFVVAEGACDGSGILDLPQPSALGQSAILGRRPARAGGGSPLESGAATPREQPISSWSPTPAGSRRRRAIWGALALVGLAIGLVVAGLALRGWLRGEGAPTDATHGALSPSERVEVEHYLSQDTPSGYHGAATRCEAARAQACQAEAELLLGLRYGPDRVRQATAAALIAGLDADAAWSDPAERGRVLGLLALARGDLVAADEALGGDDRRSRLYRGWVALARGDQGQAQEIAAGLLAGAADDPAAGLLAIESDTPATLDDLRSLAAAHPEHPRIHEALVAALIDEGALVEAELLIASLEASPRASASARASRDLFQAAILERRGQLSRALELYDRARADAPERRDLLRRRARLLLSAGDHARLRADLEAELAADPSALDILAPLVELELRSGRPRAAQALVERLADAPADPRADAIERVVWEPYLRGLVERARGDADDALASLAEARELDPSFVDALIAEVEVLRDLGQVSAAAALLTRARAETSAPEARRRLLATEVDGLLAADHRAAALALLDRALAGDPGDNEARIRRGALRWELGLRALGRADLLAVYERAGPLAGLVAPLGRIYLSDGDDAAAHRLIAATLDDQRQGPEVTLLAAELAFRRRDLATASALIHKHRLRQPAESWRGELLQAKILEAKGDEAEALAIVSRIRPPRPDAEVNLVAGRLLEADGQRPAALDRYRRARHLDPGSSDAERRYLAGLTQVDPHGAIAELGPRAAAGAIPPEFELLLVRAEISAGAPAEALALVERRLAARPNDHEASYWRGVALAALQRVEPAIVALERSLDGAAPTEPWVDDALERLILAHEDRGESETAAAYRARRGGAAPDRRRE